MNLKISILASVLALSAFSVACGSTQKTEERSLGGNMIIDAANGQLAKVPVIGFPPFGTSMPITQFDQYGENSATAAKAVIASMPAGYKLQVTGHANQHAQKSAGYTKNLSTQRAKYVYNYFVKKGVDKSKLTYVGVGDSEPDTSLSRDQNRRVTFRLVEGK